MNMTQMIQVIINYLLIYFSVIYAEFNFCILFIRCFYYLSFVIIYLYCMKIEVLEYAKFLSMDPVKDKEFLWIAREGLKAPLPEHWKAVYVENLISL